MELDGLASENKLFVGFDFFFICNKKINKKSGEKSSKLLTQRDIMVLSRTVIKCKEPFFFFLHYNRACSCPSPYGQSPHLRIEMPIKRNTPCHKQLIQIGHYTKMLGK